MHGITKPAFVAILIILIALTGCTARGSSGAPAEAAAAEPELPAVSTAQAEQAVADAMLVSGLALFLVFGAEEGATSISDEAGTLELSWDEEADFNSGVGMYTITMRDYTIPADDPFAADYNGYVMSGTVITGSSDGIAATMTIDLQMRHEDPESFPVQTLELTIRSADMQDANATAGAVTVNGHTVDIADLAQALGS